MAMQHPSVLIVTDYNGLCAYLLLPDGVAEILNHIDFHHDCPTNVPLVGWSAEDEGYCMLAGQIEEILARYEPEGWGLACPRRMLDPLLERIGPAHLRTLVIEKGMDVCGITVSNVAGAFNLCRGPALAVPEHA